jgi:nitrite reductase (NADH) large subunit
MPDSAEVCGCNGVSKGTICKAIKEKGLFTLEDVRKHTKASASCGSCTGLVEQIIMFTAGGDYSAAPKKKADVRLHRPHAPGSARCDPRTSC